MATNPPSIKATAGLFSEVEGYRFITLEEVDSTNEEARRHALSGDIDPPLWIRALRQTAGRGRRGRQWNTGSGNIAASLVLSPGVNAEAAARLSFVAALAVYDMLSDFLPTAPLGLKWPNDVLVGNKKISGILLEAGSEASANELAWLVIGIGVNVTSHPEGTPYPATHLHEHLTGESLPDAEACFTKLAAWFDQWLSLWRAQGFGPIREAWLVRALGIGGEITIRLPHEEFTAFFETFDEAGNLVLKTAQGEKRIIGAGEVYFPVSL